MLTRLDARYVQPLKSHLDLTQCFRRIANVRRRKKAMNGLRTTILLAALTALVVWIGQMVGGPNGAIMALIMAGTMNFFSYWFSDKIVLKMYGAQEITANDDPELYGMVQELAAKGG